MNWTEIKGDPFRYNGKKVTRRRVVSKTILGVFEVFEAVGGRVFFRHPFIAKQSIGPMGFDNGTEEWFGKSKLPCKSIEEGVQICEDVMKAVQAKIASY